jgi:hypothetical protein
MWGWEMKLSSKGELRSSPRGLNLTCFANWHSYATFIRCFGIEIYVVGLEGPDE